MNNRGWARTLGRPTPSPPLGMMCLWGTSCELAESWKMVSANRKSNAIRQSPAISKPSNRQVLQDGNTIWKWNEKRFEVPLIPTKTRMTANAASRMRAPAETLPGVTGSSTETWEMLSRNKMCTYFLCANSQEACANQFPWLATVNCRTSTSGGGWLCTGSFIYDNWVMTAGI